MKRITIISLICCFTFCITSAQQRNFRQEFLDYNTQQHNRFEDTRSEQQKSFDEKRKEQNRTYIGYLRELWKQYEATEPLQPETINQIIPMEYSDTATTILNTPLSIDTQPVVLHDAEEPIVSTNAVVFAGDTAKINHEELVIIPHSFPRPEPIAHIQPIEQECEIVSVALYGTLISVSFPKDANLSLHSINEDGIAALWEQISDTVVPSRFDITIASCLKLRNDMNLCDWAYLKMVQAIAKRRYGNINVATIFAAYIMAQSGYQMRLAFTESYVYMLLASHHEIYGMNRFLLQDVWYYMIDGRGEKTCYISNVGYDKEQKLSLFITDELKIDAELSDTIIATSRQGWSLPIQTNINLIKFYNDYPSGRIFYGDESSKWLIGVNTPLDGVTKKVLYPQIRQSVRDLTPWQAVDKILNWVQTAFKYNSDDTVWGYDRAFFAAETLYYPYSDCEDRAILFTTLVREILELDVVLLYYDNPCHLATAVHFPHEEPAGEFVRYNNKRYIVCDPTYLNAPIGKKMTCFKDKQPKIVVINN